MDLEFFNQQLKQAELWDLCKNFIKDQRIICPEAVAQAGNVIENAYEFIFRVCEIVGYHEGDV